nr:hypothetical protein B0A51_06976 [Rachicladosporium sp. CCFEE 5018]
MFVSKSIALFAALGLVNAVDFNYAYGATGFFAWKAAYGVDVAQKAYTSCTEKPNTDVNNPAAKAVVKAPCVFDCMRYVFGAIGSTMSAGYGVALAESGIGGVQEKESKDPPTKRSDSKAMALLTAFNAHLTAIHGPEGIQADALISSEVHPHDGFAMKMNIYNDNGDFLHLHTNGTSAMVLFHPDNTTTLARRQTYLDTQSHYYTWSGLDGLKVVWHNINHDPNNAADFNRIMNAWALSDLQPKPILSTADAWDYEACNTAGTATFFYGRVIFELNRPGFNYEEHSPRGCNR